MATHTVPRIRARRRHGARPAALAAQSQGVDEHLTSLLAPASPDAEQYRVVRHILEQLRAESGLKVIAVTSPAAGDGKTTTAINVAGALAQNRDARVLLVDADLRKPSVGARLGMESDAGPGLVEAILDAGYELPVVAQHRSAFNLWVLPAGRCPAITYEVLRSPRVGTLLNEARAMFDYVVLDTPPALLLADSRVIARWVDGMLLVVTAHQTPAKLVGEALSVLEPAKVVGLIFNGDERPLAGYYKSYYKAYYARYRETRSQGILNLFPALGGGQPSREVRWR